MAAPSSRLRWPLGIYRVAGISMSPTYKPGETLLGWRWFRPHVGQVIVARPPSAAVGPLIKRISRLEPSGLVWLLGDNPAHSTDSRLFGSVPNSALEAVIFAKLP